MAIHCLLIASLNADSKGIPVARLPKSKYRTLWKSFLIPSHGDPAVKNIFEFYLT